MSSANIHLFAEDVGAGIVFPGDAETGVLFRIPLSADKSIAIAGRVSAAVALRDALNSVIEQAEALAGGTS